MNMTKYNEHTSHSQFKCNGTNKIAISEAIGPNAKFTVTMQIDDGENE